MINLVLDTYYFFLLNVSDEAVAAFLEVSGGSLTELSLIKFAEVSN